MKRRGIKSLILAIIGASVVGCAPQPPKPLYNYGTYSDSYYAYKKNTGDQTAQTLQQSIEDAIAQSNESQTGRVAPGMYANLGYIYLKAGKTQQAIENFNKEKLTYPESSYFMDKLIKRVQDTQGKKND